MTKKLTKEKLKKLYEGNLKYRNKLIELHKKLNNKLKNIKN